MNNVSVEVLLATYNGAKYLSEQIDSILEQSRQDFRILIRDDDSSDDTLPIIRSYTQQYPEKITQIINHGRSVGVIANFSKLLEVSTAPYVMLCDQDDIWLPDKIECSLLAIQQIERIHPPLTPVLVHSDLFVVDENLDEIAPSFLRYASLNPDRDNFHQLLIQNVITGCSTIINRALVDKVSPIPTQALMHDWWIALVASGLGEVGFIERPTVLYRQHGENTLGARNFNLSYVYSKARGLFKVRGHSILKDNFKQADIFKDIFLSQLAPEHSSLLNTFISLDNETFLIRRYLLIKHRFSKGKFVQNVGLFLKI